jgi:hypothetical protein
MSSTLASQAKKSLFENRRCALCKKSNVPRTSRYLETPLICNTCFTESPPVDTDGNKIHFSNIGMSGGLMSITVLPDGSTKDIMYPKEHFFIKGHPCRAGEARFGGVYYYAVLNEVELKEFNELPKDEYLE